jgi:hypothetical protein
MPPGRIAVTIPETQQTSADDVRVATFGWAGLALDF